MPKKSKSESKRPAVGSADAEVVNITTVEVSAPTAVQSDGVLLPHDKSNIIQTSVTEKADVLPAPLTAPVPDVAPALTAESIVTLVNAAVAESRTQAPSGSEYVPKVSSSPVTYRRSSHFPRVNYRVQGQMGLAIGFVDGDPAYHLPGTDQNPLLSFDILKLAATKAFIPMIQLSRPKSTDGYDAEPSFTKDTFSTLPNTSREMTIPDSFESRYAPSDMFAAAIGSTPLGTVDSTTFRFVRVLGPLADETYNRANLANSGFYDSYLTNKEYVARYDAKGYSRDRYKSIAPDVTLSDATLRRRENPHLWRSYNAGAGGYPLSMSTDLLLMEIANGGNICSEAFASTAAEVVPPAILEPLQISVMFKADAKYLSAVFSPPPGPGLTLYSKAAAFLAAGSTGRFEVDMDGYTQPAVKPYFAAGYLAMFPREHFTPESYLSLVSCYLTGVMNVHDYGTMARTFVDRRLQTPGLPGGLKAIANFTHRGLPRYELPLTNMGSTHRRFIVPFDEAAVRQYYGLGAAGHFPLSEMHSATAGFRERMDALLLSLVGAVFRKEIVDAFSVKMKYAEGFTNTMLHLFKATFAIEQGNHHINYDDVSVRDRFVISLPLDGAMSLICGRFEQLVGLTYREVDFMSLVPSLRPAQLDAEFYICSYLFATNRLFVQREGAKATAKEIVEMYFSKTAPGIEARIDLYFALFKDQYGSNGVFQPHPHLSNLRYPTGCLLRGAKPTSTQTFADSVRIYPSFCEQMPTSIPDVGVFLEAPNDAGVPFGELAIEDALGAQYPVPMEFQKKGSVPMRWLCDIALMARKVLVIESRVLIELKFEDLPDTTAFVGDDVEVFYSSTTGEARYKVKSIPYVFARLIPDDNRRRVYIRMIALPDADAPVMKVFTTRSTSLNLFDNTDDDEAVLKQVAINLPERISVVPVTEYAAGFRVV